MKKFIATALVCVFSTCSVLAGNYDYSKVESASISFYDANMCGDKVSSRSNVTWRGNCHSDDLKVPLDTTHTDLTQDFITANKSILDKDNDGCVDVSGGYHDAGDYVKFGLTQMYTATTLQWALYEYKDTFQKNGDMEHFNTVLNHFTEYIKKCTFMNDKGEVVAFCYQVGDGKTDHEYWGAPEVQTTERPAYFATKANPATDITSLAAAALAADYVNNGNEESLKYAKALYTFGADNSIKQVGDDHAPSGDEYYKSGGYNADIAFGATWLYIATGDTTYLNSAKTNVASLIDDASSWIYDWDDTELGTITLIAEKTNDETYWNVLKETLDTWKTKYNSPQGYACIDKWGSARYNTDAQFLALLYSKYKNDNSYAQWAKTQMDYLLGDNTAKTCYVTGLSENSVKYPHHAAATGFTDPDSKAEHKYALYGALVGGPDKKDKHIDKTSDYQYNEVAIDYNAGFVGASAGINALFGGEYVEESTVETTKSETSSETTTQAPVSPSISNNWDFTGTDWTSNSTGGTVYISNGLTVRHNGTGSVAGYKFDRNSKTPKTNGYYVKLNAGKGDKVVAYINSDSSGGKDLTLTIESLSSDTSTVVETKTVNAKKTGEYSITFDVPTDGTYIIYTDSTSTASAYYNKIELQKAVLKGDVNNDSVVDSKDIVLLLKHISGGKKITDEQALINADVNSDDTIDLRDMIALIKSL